MDLIGVSDPSFYNYFPQTDKWYKRLVNAEDQLASMQLLADYSYGLDGYPKQRYFNSQSVYAGIEDDHIPFLKRGNNERNEFMYLEILNKFKNLGVPILHLIPSPFPEVWHKQSDNLSALDFNTIANLNKIMRIFVSEYLSLDIN